MKFNSRLFMNTADIVSIPGYFLLMRHILVKRKIMSISNTEEFSLLMLIVFKWSVHMSK